MGKKVYVADNGHAYVKKSADLNPNIWRNREACDIRIFGNKDVKRATCCIGVRNLFVLDGKKAETYEEIGECTGVASLADLIQKMKVAGHGWASLDLTLEIAQMVKEGAAGK